jgi:hypothetical protein
MIRKVYVIYMLLMVWHTSAFAYNIETHGTITQNSYPKTVLTTTSLLIELGLEESINPFEDIYYDISDTEIKKGLRGYARARLYLIRLLLICHYLSKAGSCVAPSEKMTYVCHLYNSTVMDRLKRFVY